MGYYQSHPEVSRNGARASAARASCYQSGRGVMTGVQDKAREAYESMEYATREDGSVYARVKDDAPECEP
jgi:hypothetical protein